MAYLARITVVRLYRTNIYNAAVYPDKEDNSEKVRKYSIYQSQQTSKLSHLVSIAGKDYTGICPHKHNTYIPEWVRGREQNDGTLRQDKIELENANDESNQS